MQINLDKTKTLATDRQHCRICVDDKAVAKVDNFSCLGSLITDDSDCTNRYGQDSIKDYMFAHPLRIYGKVTIFVS